LTGFSSDSVSPDDDAFFYYVLDTNVLLYDPGALYVFEEHTVVIPITVIEEVDRFKKDLNETGRNTRSFSRFVDKLRTEGSLRDGVALPYGGRLMVAFANAEERDEVIPWGPDNNDNRILQLVVRLHREHPGHVALITRDTNMRLKCDALGIVAQDYQHSRLQVEEQYSGSREVDVPSALIDKLYQAGSADIKVLNDYAEGLFPHQFLMLNATDKPGQTAMVRYDVRKGKLRLVGRHKEGVWGIFARNKEQLFAMDLLLDESVQLVTLNGFAGTGKTLLALACGLRMVADEQRYRRMLVSRPIFPLGRDMGFLPGDVEEKLNPWMKPIFDNLELLVATQHDVGRGKHSQDPHYQYLLHKKLIMVEPLTYIRGRSIPQQYLIIDEAQNLTPHEVKTVLTRAGEGTKIVMTGDPYQIDNPYVDALSNGLIHVVERFKTAEVAGHVTLRKGERSELAELAAGLL
jgi:PhoH-like ATPase